MGVSGADSASESVFASRGAILGKSRPFVHQTTRGALKTVAQSTRTICWCLLRVSYQFDTSFVAPGGGRDKASK